jgi:calcineurin-like phosphoesterase family protein
MAVFFSADHHFGDARARTFYRRPFASVADMDRAMIERWNAVVQPADVVWHLGDFAVRQTADRVETLLRVLNGRKHLVVGNNDNDAVTGSAGWLSVHAYAELVVDGVRLAMCHYPFRTWRDMNKGAVNLHGHSHGRLKPLLRQFDVGVDVYDFGPVTLADILTRPKPRRA